MTTVVDQAIWRNPHQYRTFPNSRPNPEALATRAMVDRTLAALTRANIAAPEVYVVQDGVPNALTWPDSIEIHTGQGMEPQVVPAIILHELSHWRRGDLQDKTTPTPVKELRADWGAGYMMAQLNVPQDMRQAAIALFGTQTPGDHNTGPLRQQALRDGAAAFYAGKSFFDAP